jgi:endo-1,4-beta-xylanase
MASHRSIIRAAHRRKPGACAIVAVLVLVASACELRTQADKSGVLIGAGATNPSYLEDSLFARVLAREFNSLSPENELKWSFTEPQQGVFDFTKLDRLAAYALEHDMVMKGHGLISGCCNPAWLQQITDTDELRAAMALHFETLMTRYAGIMDRWDVVTEPLSIAGGTGLSQNHFSQVLGADYIAEAFEIAHAADPDAKLFLNESLVEVIPVKRQELYDLVAGLVAAGVPIHGVGFEMHIFGRPEPGVITAMVDSYEALGLEVAITEMDVQLNPNGPDPLEVQAETYRRIVTEALDAGIRDISFWGFTDKYHGIWPAENKPLLFDEHYNPKPAFWAVWGALHQLGVQQSRP